MKCLRTQAFEARPGLAGSQSLHWGLCGWVGGGRKERKLFAFHKASKAPLQELKGGREKEHALEAHRPLTLFTGQNTGGFQEGNNTGHKHCHSKGSRGCLTPPRMYTYTWLILGAAQISRMVYYLPNLNDDTSRMETCLGGSVSALP